MIQYNRTDDTFSLLQNDRPAIADLPAFELKSLQSFPNLPQPSPKNSSPKFTDGEVVRWLPLPGYLETQTGIILGHFYAYARHLKQWKWKYLVWLSQPSGRVVADTAWETDLETWTGEADHD